jgi:hypothetical protein
MLLGLAAAATSGAALSACGPVEAGEAAQVPLPLSTTVPINPPSPDYFTPDRFKGKTVIVTGCARGMGAGAAQRAAREGAMSSVSIGSKTSVPRPSATSSAPAARRPSSRATSATPRHARPW